MSGRNLVIYILTGSANTLIKYSFCNVKDITQHLKFSSFSFIMSQEWTSAFISKHIKLTPSSRTCSVMLNVLRSFSNPLLYFWKEGVSAEDVSKFSIPLLCSNVRNKTQHLYPNKKQEHLDLGLVLKCEKWLRVSLIHFFILMHQEKKHQHLKGAR